MAYKYYGGRGITVCDRWLASYDNFISDMGTRPSLGHSIDRINSNGNYEPSNCRWATKKEQTRNRSINKIISIDGVQKYLYEWLEEIGIKRDTYMSRKRVMGMTDKEALLTPLLRKHG